MRSPAIECKNVFKTFGTRNQKVTALNDVSLSLFKGELNFIMGPSGSGKSSLIAALGGLQAPDTGQVRGPDGDIWKGSATRVRKYRSQYCGFVFQSIGLFGSLSALDQIILPLRLIGVPSREAERRARNTLEWVGLENYHSARPSEMSGGENQRVAIARMLAKRPKLIFCDEPTSALDTENGKNIVHLLRRAAHENEAMILCATHDERIVSMADRIIKFEDGSIVHDSQ